MPQQAQLPVAEAINPKRVDDKYLYDQFRASEEREAKFAGWRDDFQRRAMHKAMNMALPNEEEEVRIDNTRINSFGWAPALVMIIAMLVGAGGLAYGLYCNQNGGPPKQESPPPATGGSEGVAEFEIKTYIDGKEIKVGESVGTDVQP